MTQISAWPEQVLAYFRKLFGLNSLAEIDAKIQRVRKIFQGLDCDVRSFQKRVKLNCLVRCGHCCENPNIETTVFEMLPSAQELIATAQAETWYNKAEQLDFNGRCVFYSAETNSRAGHCSVYFSRPTICRLFGFSGNKDKYGKPRLVTCAPVKQAFPEALEQAIEDVIAGRTKMPLMADYMMKISAIDPDSARENMPVNLAFKKALERLWIREQFKH